MSTNACNAVMTRPLFNKSSWWAQNTNAGSSSVPTPNPIPLCDKRALAMTMYDDCCCSSLWGFGCGFGINKIYGSQAEYAEDAGKAMTKYNKEVFKGSGYTLGNAFVGGLAGLFNNQSFAANITGAFFGGLGNFMSNVGKG